MRHLASPVGRLLGRWATSSRRALWAFPFGCLAALLTHAIRFEDDHAFGGAGNEGIVAVAICGCVAFVVLVVHRQLNAATTTMTGTLARYRAEAVLPGPIAIAAAAAGWYHGIEALEGHGLELGWPTAVLIVIASGLALLLRWWCRDLAAVVAAIVGDCSQSIALAAPTRVVAAPALNLPRAQLLVAARRLGRAPPPGRLPTR